MTTSRGPATYGGTTVSEPDFELLPQPARPWRGPWVVGLAAAAALLSGAWAGYEWMRYRHVASQYAALLAERAHAPVASGAAAPPAYEQEALQVAALLQAPVDAWLRELENCQASNARTAQLSIDVPAGRVTTLVDVRGTPELTVWLQCLNAGLHRPPWRIVRMTNEPQGAGSTEPQWKVELIRERR